MIVVYSLVHAPPDAETGMHGSARPGDRIAAPGWMATSVHAPAQPSPRRHRGVAAALSPCVEPQSSTDAAPAAGAKPGGDILTSRWRCHP